MSDFLTEVDEALKQERMEKLWKEYGNLFLGFLGMLVLGTALNAGYKSWNTSKNERDTQLLTQTIEKTTYSAQDLQEVLPEISSSGVKALTTLIAASKSLQDEDAQSAHTIYATLSEDKSAPEDLRSLSEYMATTIAPDADINEKLSSLLAIAQDSENPWYMQAALDYAVLIAHEKQDYAAARQSLKIIIDAQTTMPNRLSGIASALDILYGMKESDKAAQ